MASKFAQGSTIVWKDRKRWLGMPLTFTKYTLVENNDWTKLYVNTGLLFTHEEEINLYRIYDISISQSLGDKIFGVGTITLYSKDESSPCLNIIKVKKPYEVRNMLAKMVEQEKAKRGFRVAEFN